MNIRRSTPPLNRSTDNSISISTSEFRNTDNGKRQWERDTLRASSHPTSRSVPAVQFRNSEFEIEIELPLPQSENSITRNPVRRRERRSSTHETMPCIVHSRRNSSRVRKSFRNTPCIALV